MEKYNREFGAMGERAAERYLRRRGYKILERNLYVRGGELDIIAQKGGYTVFAEVKTRRSEQFGTPAEGVTPHKMRSIQKTAAIYMMNREETYLRFDVVEVFAHMKGEKFHVDSINHIENAF